jgi:hypothetical protein
VGVLMWGGRCSFGGGAAETSSATPAPGSAPPERDRGGAGDRDERSTRSRTGGDARVGGGSAARYTSVLQRSERASEGRSFAVVAFSLSEWDMPQTTKVNKKLDHNLNWELAARCECRRLD